MGLATFNRARRLSADNKSEQADNNTAILKADPQKLERIETLQKKLEEKGKLTKKESEQLEKLLEWKEKSEQTENNADEDDADNDNEAE